MTYAQFLDQFSRVMEAFPNKFPQVVLERIHDKVDDLTPVEMRELCNLIIDQCEHAPRTHKVSELASLVRARNHEGLYRPKEEIPILCHGCQDLGILRVISTGGDGFETLVRCLCREGDLHPAKLPRWSPDFRQLFTYHHCPIEWFKPEIPADLRSGSISEEAVAKRLHKIIQNQRAYWDAKLALAEGYWAHNIPTPANTEVPHAVR